MPADVRTFYKWWCKDCGYGSDEPTDSIVEAVREGERRALCEWQYEHREPCNDCQWSTNHLRVANGTIIRTAVTLDACPKHGGQP